MRFEKTGKPVLLRGAFRRVSTLLLALCLACLFGCRAERTPENRDTAGISALCVRDGALCDANGNPFQLRGVSTHGIAWFPEYINAGAFESVKNAGGNAIRIAMYTDTENGYLADPERNLLLVRQAIEDARALDLYAIVDWHILSDGNPNDHLSEAITFFDAVASEYANDPAVIYEICNEPNGVSWEEIKEYSWAMIHVIRKYSPQAVIIVGTPGYSYNIEAAAADPLPVENLLYSFHYYAGEMSRYANFIEALDRGLAVIVSEWGIGFGSDGAPAIDQGKEFLDKLNSRGVSWCAWSLCSKDEVYSLLRPDCKKISGFLPEDLSETGTVVFNGLGGGT
ncbi:MAG: glycoside hydrolase family 5 protein [Clostridia bacterium]|nr:glycoside hydrolase family 5 protein [Clostridia bacterium]